MYKIAINGVEESKIVKYRNKHYLLTLDVYVGRIRIRERGKEQIIVEIHMKGVERFHLKKLVKIYGFELTDYDYIRPHKLATFLSEKGYFVRVDEDGEVIGCYDKNMKRLPYQYINEKYKIISSRSY